MAVLFDTNVLFTIARDPSREQTIRNKVNPDHEQEVISIVIVAELWSLVRQNSWGNKRLTDVETLLQKMVVIRVDSDLLVDRYVELDVFSQGKDPKLRLTLTGPDKSARNMGKNDLWIAATASLFNLRLITTDADFDHLEADYLRLSKFPHPLI